MKHKHAELMLQYALDAMETNKPWERWEGGFGRYCAQIAPLSFHDDKLYRRKADAPPVPWHLLDRYVHESAVNPEINPQKSVDLSVLIDSGIDAGYGEAEEPLWFQPTSVNTTVKSMIRYEHAPRMNYWFSEKNFEYPGELVWALGNAGFAVEESHDASDFQITGLQDGYCWPWELEGDSD